MKASDLITKLQEIIAEHGDLDVVGNYNDDIAGEFVPSELTIVEVHPMIANDHDPKWVQRASDRYLENNSSKVKTVILID